MQRAFSFLIGLAFAVLVSWGSHGIAADRDVTGGPGFEWTESADPALAGLETPRQAPAPMTERPIQLPDGTVVAQFCCRHCQAGKPCGDSCISRKDTCRKGPGCACATVDIY